MGEYTLVLSLYEMLSKESMQLPTYIPYVDFLPHQIRFEIFSQLKRPLEKDSRGEVKVKIFFELLLDQYLDADYGEPESCDMPRMVSKRSANLCHVIRLCKFDLSMSIVPRGISGHVLFILIYLIV